MPLDSGGQSRTHQTRLLMFLPQWGWVNVSLWHCHLLNRPAHQDSRLFSSILTADFESLFFYSILSVHLCSHSALGSACGKLSFLPLNSSASHGWHSALIVSLNTKSKPHSCYTHFETLQCIVYFLLAIGFLCSLLFSCLTPLLYCSPAFVRLLSFSFYQDFVLPLSSSTIKALLFLLHWL